MAGNILKKDATSVAGKTLWGVARPGTASSATGWLIFAIDNTTQEVAYADNSNLSDKIWDSRATYTYLNA